MQQRVTLKLLPREAASETIITQYAASAISVSESSISGFHILKRSMDARGKTIWINLTIQVFVNEPFYQRMIEKPVLKDVSKSKHSVIVVGCGPAGLFAALKLIEFGIRPIIVERGKDIRARRRDLAILNKEGRINPESNYCFGEGGAGTYSDGKLYTRSTKRGDVQRILNIFVQFGAEEKILYEAHPHIGTNKLPQIITSIREQILECGGVCLFETKLTGFIISNETIKGILTGDGDAHHCDAVILATGHSARDVFQLLHNNNILIERKPFALGVRIEHPQELIDNIQYHCSGERDEFLPAASYSLVQQVSERGVFSFCMCPGGIIAPASTDNEELVINGWSPSKRNNPFANSGMVVTVEENDTYLYNRYGPLAAMQFQREVEKKAYKYGGGNFVAPAQRMVDFVNMKSSSTLPECSYLPGIRSAPLNEVLPSFIYNALRKGFVDFGNKMKGYLTNEAVVVATESRTSSPVRIPRDKETLQHVQIKKLYPCAEGAGYAGGIVSAAMDGERVADAVATMLNDEG
jgi:hypothetical protein